MAFKLSLDFKPGCLDITYSYLNSLENLLRNVYFSLPESLNFKLVQLVFLLMWPKVSREQSRVKPRVFHYFS